MSITVSRRTVPAMTVVALRGTVPTYADEPLLWDRMLPLLEQSGVTMTMPCGVIEHNDEYTERDVDLSIFLPGATGISAVSPLEVLDLPERDCLVARVEGSYDQIGVANDLLAERMASDKLALATGADAASKGFNLYLVGPADGVAPEQFATEVCWPLA